MNIQKRTAESGDVYAYYIEELQMQKLYEESILHGKCRETDETNAGITLVEIWNIMDWERDDW